MIGARTETGLAFAALGWGQIASWTMHAASVGVPVYLWMTQPGPDEIEAAALPDDLAECAAAIESGQGLTDGGRAYVLGDLETWRSAARAQFSGAQLAAANKTLDNLTQLLSSEADGEGRPVSQCHARAAFWILDRQFATLRALAPPDAEAQPAPPRTDPRTPHAMAPWAWILLALSAAAVAWLTWRRSK